MATDDICIDGLLPRAPGNELDWLSALGGVGDENGNIIDRALRSIGDVHASRHIVWPARIDGELVPPPMAHLVDWVVRAYVLAGSPAVAAEAELRPEAFTIRPVAEDLPLCTHCETQRARYDTQVTDAASWSYLCPACYAEHGLGRLGMGLGQYLVTWAEVDANTRELFLAAKRHWRARGVDVPGHVPWE